MNDDDHGHANATGALSDQFSSPLKLRLRKPHRLIQTAMAPGPKPSQFGYTPPDNRPRIDMNVSKGQERTAFALLDRLFKAVEERGMKVEVLDGYQGRGTFATHDSDKAPISLKEIYKKVEHIPTAKELREKERYSFTRIPKWDIPTGKLILTPGGPVDLSSEAAVDLVIDKAVADLESQIARAREIRLAEQERRRQEQRRQQEQQEEKARVDALVKAADALRQYRIMMEYIEEVRRFGRIPDDQRREGQTLDEWLRWAEWQARLIHPLG